MASHLIIEKINSDKKNGLLDYKWHVRSFLKSKPLSNKDHTTYKILFKEALSPFVYISRNRSKIHKDKSLASVTQLCTNYGLINDVDYTDSQLIYLAELFNYVFESGRDLFMCYDCGTVARGVFFSLIKTYRGEFNIRNDEITRIKNEYYMQKYEPLDAVNVLEKNLSNINKNAIFLCALDFNDGFEDKFGHIYIIEKIYINNVPRYRIYQSSFQLYMLIDYIEYMDYSNGLEKGVDIMQHVNDLKSLFSVDSWGKKENDLFGKWFCFYPSTRILKQDIKHFATTYLIF